jgi:hypothetical protein
MERRGGGWRIRPENIVDKVATDSTGIEFWFKLGEDGEEVGWRFLGDGTKKRVSIFMYGDASVVQC